MLEYGTHHGLLVEKTAGRKLLKRMAEAVIKRPGFYKIPDEQRLLSEYDFLTNGTIFKNTNKRIAQKRIKAYHTKTVSDVWSSDLNNIPDFPKDWTHKIKKDPQLALNLLKQLDKAKPGSYNKTRIERNPAFYARQVEEANAARKILRRSIRQQLPLDKQKGYSIHHGEYKPLIYTRTKKPIVVAEPVKKSKPKEKHKEPSNPTPVVSVKPVQQNKQQSPSYLKYGLGLLGVPVVAYGGMTLYNRNEDRKLKENNRV